MENADWFYVRGDDELGPFSDEQLQELLARGEIGPRTLTRKKTWMDWREAGTLALLLAKPSLADSGDAASSPPVATDGRPVEPAARSRPRARLRLVTAIVASLLIVVAAVAWSLSTRFKADAPATQEAEAPGEESSVVVWTPDTGIPPPPDVGSPSPPRKILDPVTLYAPSKPAVATIRTEDDSGFDAGQGSGFFIPRELVGTRYHRHESTKLSKDGISHYAYLLTNHHVIRSAADAHAQLADGRSFLISDVVMEKEQVDLAVVLVFLWPPSMGSGRIFGIAVSTLGVTQGSEPPVGQKVYAIGSPEGLETSLSEGIISGRREATEGLPRLQFTAPVSPASSGGPLLDATGQVVGVVTAQRREGQNLNFAIPASQVLAFLKGPFNSRPLWRGSGIKKEEMDAYLWSTELTRFVGVNLLFADKKIRDGNYDDALHDLASVIPSQFGKYEYLVHYTIGRAAEDRGRMRVWGGAVKTIGENRERAKNDKDWQLAKKSFRKSIELNSEYSPAYQHLADCLSGEGRFAEAFVLADLLVMRVPRCATAYKLRGRFHTELGRNLEALADFETAAELGPNDPETYWEIGQVCFSLGENAKAVIAYEAAIRLNLKLPDSRGGEGLCRYNMGLAYKRMGKFEQALACYEKAKSLGLPAQWCDEEIAKCRAQMK